MGLGERIKSILEMKQMKQSELAKRANCTEAAISKYIKGERIPRASVLSKIAVALDTTSDFLLEGTPADTKEEIIYATKLIARNAKQMTNIEKKEILEILLGEESE